jgi:hypothetical protein
MLTVTTFVVERCDLPYVSDKRAVPQASCHYTLQALEDALPSTSQELMNIAVRHARAGPPARFAACQLLQLAASCVVRSIPLPLRAHASVAQGKYALWR